MEAPQYKNYKLGDGRLFELFDIIISSGSLPAVNNLIERTLDLPDGK